MSSFTTFLTDRQSTAVGFVLPHEHGYLLKSRSLFQRHCTTCNTHAVQQSATCKLPPPQNAPQQKQDFSLHFVLLNRLYTIQTTHSWKLGHYLKGPGIMLISVRTKEGEIKITDGMLSDDPREHCILFVSCDRHGMGRLSSLS
jgi:hypothetical protein